jgi:pilus assembly protein TadC
MVAGLWALAVLLAAPWQAERRCRQVLQEREPRGEAGGADNGAVSSRVAALLDLVAAALDAGLAPSGALATVAPVLPGPDRRRLRQAASMLDVGGDSATIWRVLADDPVLGPLARALERSERSGAPVAASVRSLADEVRHEERAGRLAAARRVGIRTAVPLGACFLPAFFLIAIVPTVIALIGDAF